MRLASIGMVKDALDDVGQSWTLGFGNGKDATEWGRCRSSFDGADPAVVDVHFRLR